MSLRKEGILQNSIEKLMETFTSDTRSDGNAIIARLSNDFFDVSVEMTKISKQLSGGHG